MTYVIAEPCIGTKDTACVDVCPVDCIHPRKDEPSFEAETQLYINPAERIDCGACVQVSPLLRQVFQSEDRSHQANRNARAALDALGRINIKLKLGLDGRLGLTQNEKVPLA